MSATVITIEALIGAPVEKVWEHWNNPESVRQWNNASPDWHTPQASNDLRVGGKFNYRMEARDGSFGFDFEGEYSAVQPLTHIAYSMPDGRKVDKHFEAGSGSTRMRISFDAETQNPVEMQRAGWQAILDNFKKFVESN